MNLDHIGLQKKNYKKKVTSYYMFDHENYMCSINRNPLIGAEMKQFRELFKVFSVVSFSMNTLGW